MTGYSKDAQLGRPTDQETRRAARPNKRPRAQEKVPVSDATELASWQEAGAKALVLHEKGMERWGSRWLGITGIIGDILYEQGVINAKLVTGRNAYAVALLATAWLDDVASAAKRA